MKAGQAGTVTTRCPRRRHVSGGGVQVSGDPANAHVNATFPIDGPDRGAALDDGWRARVSNDSGGGKRVTVFALCSGMQLAYRSHAFSAPSGVATADDADCPSDGHGTGGGLTATGSVGGGQVEGIVPFDDGDAGDVPDDGWRGFYGNNAGPPRTATVFAICKT